MSTISGWVAFQRSLAIERFVAICLTFAVLFSACDQHSPTPTVSNTELDFSIPDYTISEVSDSTGGELNDLKTVYFRVRIVNLGDSTDTPTSVAMYVDGEFKQDSLVHGLPQSADTTIAFAWRAEAGTHEILFGVDRPPLDTTFLAEANENNNTATLTLTVPYGNRNILSQDTLPFAELPLAITADSTVQQAIQLAADSGYAVASDAPMIRTQYQQDGITSYTVPLGNLESPSNTAPVLVVLNSTGQVTVTFAYLFRVEDAEHFVAYSKNAGVRVSSESGTIQLSGIGSPMSCSERVIWPWGCILATGAAAIAPIANQIFANYSAPAIYASSGSISPTPQRNAAAIYSATLAASAGGPAGGDPIVPTMPAVRKNIVDNPPSFYLAVAGAGVCQLVCVGDDLHIRMSWIYLFTAVDDRGPVTYLSGRVWSIPCGGGSRTFVARDNAGQTVSLTVSVSTRPIVFPGGCKPPIPLGESGIVPNGPDNAVSYSRWSNQTVDVQTGKWEERQPCTDQPFDFRIQGDSYEPNIHVASQVHPDFESTVAQLRQYIMNNARWRGIDRRVQGGSWKKAERREHYNKIKDVYRLQRQVKIMLPLSVFWADEGPPSFITLYYEKVWYEYRVSSCHDAGGGGTP